jgi:hypothetical protein
MKLSEPDVPAVQDGVPENEFAPPLATAQVIVPGIISVDDGKYIFKYSL